MTTTNTKIPLPKVRGQRFKDLTCCPEMPAVLHNVGHKVLHVLEHEVAAVPVALIDLDLAGGVHGVGGVSPGDRRVARVTARLGSGHLLWLGARRGDLGRLLLVLGLVLLGQVPPLQSENDH